MFSFKTINFNNNNRAEECVNVYAIIKMSSQETQRMEGLLKTSEHVHAHEFFQFFQSGEK